MNYVESAIRTSSKMKNKATLHFFDFAVAGTFSVVLAFLAGTVNVWSVSAMIVCGLVALVEGARAIRLLVRANTIVEDAFYGETSPETDAYMARYAKQ